MLNGSWVRFSDGWDHEWIVNSGTMSIWSISRWQAQSGLKLPFIRALGSSPLFWRFAYLVCFSLSYAIVSNYFLHRPSSMTDAMQSWAQLGTGENEHYDIYSCILSSFNQMTWRSAFKLRILVYITRWSMWEMVTELFPSSYDCWHGSLTLVTEHMNMSSWEWERFQWLIEYVVHLHSVQDC